MGILDKNSLVNYMLFKYKESKNAYISPIKLQKGLYFLFAKWGGLVLTAQGESDQDSDDDELYGSWDKYLFEAHFCAWKYGPVDVDIWNWYKTQKPAFEDIKDCSLKFTNDNIDYKEDVKNYIDELLVRIFATSDFGLVDLSHEDKCWREAIPNEVIDNNKILTEYAQRN